MDTASDRVRAIRTARDIIRRRPLILDTETTGLHERAEIVEVAVINWDGAVLLDTLVQPDDPIPAAATAVHGITDEMVRGAPRFDVVWQAQLRGIVEGAVAYYTQPLCIYNADYDLRLIRQSLRRYGIRPAFLKPPICLMELYAQFAGELSAYFGGYRWHKLESAASLCGVSVDGAHRALTDCRMALSVLKSIAHTSQVAE